jgi:hypothetical protein
MMVLVRRHLETVVRHSAWKQSSGTALGNSRVPPRRVNLFPRLISETTALLPSGRPERQLLLGTTGTPIATRINRNANCHSDQPERQLPLGTTGLPIAARAGHRSSERIMPFLSIAGLATGASAGDRCQFRVYIGNKHDFVGLEETGSNRFQLFQTGFRDLDSASGFKGLTHA